MDKDYDHNSFMEFMKSFMNSSEPINFAFVNADDIVKMNQKANTIAMLEIMDELEADVSTRPCYNSVEDMLTAIKEM